MSKPTENNSMPLCELCHVDCSERIQCDECHLKTCKLCYTKVNNIPLCDVCHGLKKPPVIQVKNTHMMIDIETLSKKPNALIVSVGYVIFDMSGERAHGYFELDWSEQVLKNRHICPETVNWWKKKGISIPNGNDSVKHMFHSLIDNAHISNVSYFWFRGPQFDCVKLENLADDFACEVPWNYKQVCDCRTFDLFRDPDMEVVEAPHNALEDARKQAKELIHTLKYMGEVI